LKNIEPGKGRSNERSFAIATNQYLAAILPDISMKLWDFRSQNTLLQTKTLLDIFKTAKVYFPT
jgi:hypothetical protein